MIKELEIFLENNSTISQVRKTIDTNNLINKDDYILMMVSGGSDSVAMCYILNLLYDKKHLAIFHLNHKLRGSEAKKDENFVYNLSKLLGINSFFYSKDILNISNNKNIEAVSRNIRYKLAQDSLKKWADTHGVTINKFKIASAHTLNDRIENFYMRSICGTGPGGLSGIEFKNRNIIRPLLECRKTDLIEFIKQFSKIDDKYNLKKVYRDEDRSLWKEDVTNSDTNRFRAYVRNKIVPISKRWNINFENNLNNTMKLISQDSKYLNKQALYVKENTVKFNYIHNELKSVYINSNVKKYDIVLIRRVIYSILKEILPFDARVESKSMNSILKALSIHNYTDNIQGNFIVHSNNKGIFIWSAKEYRAKRKKI